MSKTIVFSIIANIKYENERKDVTGVLGTYKPNYTYTIDTVYGAVVYIYICVYTKGCLIFDMYELLLNHTFMYGGGERREKTLRGTLN